MKITEINGTNCKTYLLEANGHAALVDPVRERLETYRAILAQRGSRSISSSRRTCMPIT